MAVKDWSTTADDNDDADAAINWLENQAPSTVNNSARAMMAEFAKWFADTNGTLATTGSANAYVATTSNSYAALFDGLLLVLEANHTNTGAATLAVDGLTAKAIVENDDTALVADKITSGGTYLLRYDSANDKFYLLNPDSSSSSPITTRGDIIRGDASGDDERLAVGASGQYLSSDGTDPSWAAIAAADLPAASTTAQGAVEKATAAEVTAETADKFPDAADLKYNFGVCKARVTFDASGTLAILESDGVSSVTDNGVGSYTVNLITAMSTADYTIAGFIGYTTAYPATDMFGFDSLGVPTTTTFRVRALNTSNAAVDSERVCVSIWGNL